MMGGFEVYGSACQRYLNNNQQQQILKLGDNSNNNSNNKEKLEFQEPAVDNNPFQEEMF
jgi:hypothetical protein